jgi:ceramide glucosyltransferase
MILNAVRPPSLAEWLVLLPVILGSLYGIACVAALAVVKRRGRALGPGAKDGPAVSVLKPIYGLEKGLRENLRSTCAQDYRDFEVVFSVQRRDEPALPLLQEAQREFGPERVKIAVDTTQTAPNGKIRNLLGALPHARHDVLVISDSDVRVPPDYLRRIVAPLDEPGVGCACTFYRAVGAERWFETLEQLTFNADFVPNLVFAHVSGATRFLLGASTAIRRRMLETIGGLRELADYLVEDYEMGRRVLAAGRRIAMVPVFVDTIVDLKDARQWWLHHLYWDQNTRAANPLGLLGTGVIRAVPFAFVFAGLRLFDPLGLAVLVAAIVLRMASGGAFLWGLGDGHGLRRLFLLPVRDLAGLASWILAFVRPVVVWRQAEFVLTRDGRMLPKEPAA